MKRMKDVRKWAVVCSIIHSFVRAGTTHFIFVKNGTKLTDITMLSNLGLHQVVCMFQ